MKKSILITGHTGFVGKHLIDNLEDLYSIKLLGRSKSNLLHEQYIARINSSTNYTEALFGVDVVIHLAARVHLMDDKAINPLREFREVNTLGTMNLARQAIKANVKRFIFISTIKVNGENTSETNFFCNDDAPCPQDFYGISKAEAEEQLLNLGKNSGLEIVIIRPPLIYGEGVKANFSYLFTSVRKYIPLPFRAIKNNKRSLVSVYNLTDLVRVCIEHPKAASQVFLVSDGQDISTSEMVSLMAKVQGIPNIALPIPVSCFKLIGKFFGKQMVIDKIIGSLQIDITYTKETLNWQPPYTIEEGFAKCIEKKNV